MPLWLESFSSYDSTQYFVGPSNFYDPAGKYFVLTPERDAQAGRIFLKRTFSSQFFDASFRVFLGNRSASNANGGDGLVLAFAPLYDYPTSGGGGMNFDGSFGYAVELDTYFNPQRNDPSDEHIGIIRDGVIGHFDVARLPDGTLKNDQWHSISVTMNDGFVEVIMDGTSYIRWTIPNFQIIDSYFGFTAATGASFNKQAVDDISITVPARTHFDLGAINICEKSSLDTTIELTNNTSRSYFINNAQITDLTGANEFSFLQPFAGIILAPGQSTQVQIHFSSQSLGRKVGILSFTSSTGERIIDTLLVIVDQPQIILSTNNLSFPSTHVGRSSDLIVTLQNPKSIPFRVDSIRFTGRNAFDFSIVQPTIPFTIPPNLNVNLQIRFTPRADTIHSASLLLFNNCISIPPISLNGEGEIKALRLRIDSAYVISPFTTVTAHIDLLDAPPPSIVLGYETLMSFDPFLLNFVDVDWIGTLSERYTVNASLIQPGLIRIGASGTDTLKLPGLLLKINFKSIRADTGCSAIRLSQFIFNPQSALANIPRDTIIHGRICVNPSCRIPAGLVRVQINPNRLYQNTPNPFNPLTRISFYINAPQHISLRIFDLFGRELRKLFEGNMNSGNHSITYDANGLPSGTYRYVLNTEEGLIEKSMSLIR